MNKKTVSITLITLVTALMTGCEKSSTDSGLEYKAGNSFFHLKKDCVLQVSSRDVTPPVVLITVKQSDKCSEEFNDFFLNNLNNNLTVSFNGEKIMEAKILSPIKTERGINQSIPDQSKALKIANYYK
ncbi:hypothetical protein [Superficieibacter sp. 1612_C1]|uniref:hypothetical protein n=1 Tax=Superficieibacter sp. 1612_C1 TaxID=2780382 RepID=UPI00188480E9|nr:hypothetical protein [Superficieibacter sp. 1612_C1]